MISVALGIPHTQLSVPVQAAARAHRHAASGRRGSRYGDGDLLDGELDSDKNKKRVAVDQGRVCMPCLMQGT